MRIEKVPPKHTEKASPASDVGCGGCLVAVGLIVFVILLIASALT